MPSKRTSRSVSTESVASELYEVEEILNVRGHGANQEFFVRWLNYGPEDDSWEPRENLKACNDIIARFYRNRSKNVEKIRKTFSNSSSSSSNEIRNTKIQNFSSNSTSEKRTNTNSVDDIFSAYSDEETSVDNRSSNSTPDVPVPKTSGKNTSKRPRQRLSWWRHMEGNESLLRDPFWKNLEEGKMNFDLNEDVYQRVKRGRAAASASRNGEDKDNISAETNGVKRGRRNMKNRNAKRKKDNEGALNSNFSSKKSAERIENAINSVCGKDNFLLETSQISSTSPEIEISNIPREKMDENRRNFLNEIVADAEKALELFTEADALLEAFFESAKNNQISDENSTISITEIEPVIPVQNEKKQEKEEENGKSEKTTRKKDKYQKADRSTKIVLASGRVPIYSPVSLPSTQSPIQKENGNEKEKEEENGKSEKTTRKKDKSQKADRPSKIILASERVQISSPLSSPTTPSPSTPVTPAAVTVAVPELPLPVTKSLSVNEFFKNELRLSSAPPRESKHLSQRRFADACRAGDVDYVRRALAISKKKGGDDKAIDVNYGDPDTRTTLLMTAAMHRCDGTHKFDDIIDVLIANGAKVNARNGDDETALVVAIHANQPCKAAKLIASGAALNLPTRTGETPLMLACRTGSVVFQLRSVVFQLLEYGADFHAQTDRGDTVFTCNEADNPCLAIIKNHVDKVGRIFHKELRCVLQDLHYEPACFQMHCYALNESNKFRVVFDMRNEQIFEPSSRRVYVLAVAMAKFWPGQQYDVRFWGATPVMEVKLNDVKQKAITENGKFLFTFWPLKMDVNELIIECDERCKQSQYKLLIQPHRVLM